MHQYCEAMRKSKLEFYCDVISALAKKALTIEDIAFECNTSCVTLERRLDFLVIHDIVSIEISRDNRPFYVLSNRGVAIAKPVTASKRLEKLNQRAFQTAMLPEFKEKNPRGNKETGC